MNADPLTLSLDTLLAVSPMLGHALEDRSKIRNGQDSALVRFFQEASTLPFHNAEQQRLFLVAPLDLLVVDAGGEKQFHIIETNGTGIGGLTNMPPAVVGTILSGLTEMARGLSDPDPLVLVAVSGIESSKKPRHNHLIHEKAFYLEALKRGFEASGRPARVLSMALLQLEPDAIHTNQPTVVLGYIKEFLNALGCDRHGRLSLFGRTVTAGVNDRFCLNVFSRFAGQIDMERFLTLNRCFLAGADKGVAYELLNEYAAIHAETLFPARTVFTRANSRTELIVGILDWLRRGKQVVIKAQGTGLGHGIEFFLDLDEPLDDIVGKVDHSIRVTEHYYGAVGGAFPYTLCEFVNTSIISHDAHPLHGHKYEIRVVVYRDGASLRAFPSIAKVSSQGYDADHPDRLSLINNITTSAEAKKRAGTDFMLPLSCSATLDLLGIHEEQMRSVCAYCTGYVRHILDRLQQSPQRFLLRTRPDDSAGWPIRTSTMAG